MFKMTSKKLHKEMWNISLRLWCCSFCQHVFPLVLPGAELRWFVSVFRDQQFPVTRELHEHDRSQHHSNPLKIKKYNATQEEQWSYYFNYLFFGVFGIFLKYSVFPITSFLVSLLGWWVREKILLAAHTS